MTPEDERELVLLRRHFGLSYVEWCESPAWYLDLLLAGLGEQQDAPEHPEVGVLPDTLDEWK